MTKPKKKPKTGDVVGWVVLDNEGDVRGMTPKKTREMARLDVQGRSSNSDFAPYRIAKIVLAK